MELWFSIFLTPPIIRTAFSFYGMTLAELKIAYSQNVFSLFSSSKRCAKSQLFNPIFSQRFVFNKYVIDIILIMLKYPPSWQTCQIWQDWTFLQFCYSILDFSKKLKMLSEIKPLLPSAIVHCDSAINYFFSFNMTWHIQSVLEQI